MNQGEGDATEPAMIVCPNCGALAGDPERCESCGNPIAAPWERGRFLGAIVRRLQELDGSDLLFFAAVVALAAILGWVFSPAFPLTGPLGGRIAVLLVSVPAMIILYLIIYRDD